MSHMCKMMEGVRKHKGGCHCGRVRFEVTAPSQITVFECSCNICQKRQSRYFMVEADRFLLLQGHGDLSTFGSSEVKHSFCTTCGVQSFFIPSSGDNTGSVGIMPHCLDPGTLKKIKTKKRNPNKSKENDDPLHRAMATA